MAAAIEVDYRSAGLDARRLAMLGYVDKLTRTPGEMARSDTERLREVGSGDEDILAMTEVAGYYAYANRVVAALGVELEGHPSESQEPEKLDIQGKQETTPHSPS